MWIKKFVLISAITITTPMIVNAADVHVLNLTDSYGTGSINGRCSSDTGDSGIAEPGKSITIPQWVITFMCGFSDCNGYVYGSKNCTGKRIATLKMNSTKGVTQISEIDANYSVTGSGENVVVKPVAGFKSWIKSLFN